MMISDEIREPATRIGGTIRSCTVEWFEDKADRVAKMEKVTEKFKKYVEEYYSVRGEVKKSYGVEKDDRLVQMYWELKDLE